MQRKTIVWLAALGCASTLTLQGQSVQITERGAHHRVIESVGQQFDATGQLVTVTNQFTELANGLHYWDEGQWKETEEVIELLNDGAVALKGPHKVIFSPNINTAGAIDLETSEGQRFQSQVFGLSYLDTSTGESVLIAELKDSYGELIADNQVLYPDAFTDFEADVRFTYTKAGFEQDIILRQNPPSPSEYGLNPETTQLQVLTEFFDPPQPINQVDDEGNTNIVREFISENLTDEKLEFGSMHIGKGKAFTLDGGESSNLPAERTGGHPVGKQWDQLEGRNFLIESVEYPRLAPELEQLQAAPPVEEARLKSPNRKLVQIIQQRTPSVEAKVDGSIKKLAQATHRPGVVVDYVIVNTVANHTFTNGVTYYVGGAVTLSGLTVIEGGTIIKYTNDAQIKIQGWVDCRTDAYRPAIFTSKDDNTVGENIPGSTGSPYGNYYANAALYLDDKASELQHLRIAYAKEAIYYDNDSGDPSRLRHVQLVHCLRGVQPRATPLFVQNVLMHNVQTNFYNATYNVKVYGEHLTINTADKLNAATGTITLYLTNSLLVAVTTTNGYSGEYNYTYPSAVGVLQTVGAAANYLADGSELRNAGTEHITPRLKSDLTKLTTMPPIVWTNHITTSTVFAPEAQRDSDTPDIGYHYYPLDYVSGGINVSNVLVLTNGVAVGVYGSTPFNLSVGGQFITEGTIERLNWIARYNTVQEQYTNTWSASTVGTSVAVNTATTPQPKVTARFTGWSIPSLSGYHFEGNVQVTNVMTFRDCQFYGSRISVRGFPMDQFNNLFERVGVSLNTAGYSIAYNQYNNLFYGGSLALTVSSTSINKDNQYFFTDLPASTSVTHDYNAYYTGAEQLPSPGANDVVLTNWGFLQGPLGRYYHRSTTLSGTGSRTAANAGLYHHTVRIGQTKEGSGTVDIGFHYPSVALTNLALNKIATQSSDYSGSHTATNGVNGNQLGTLAHTQTENNAWWQVDLGTTNFIDSVWIWNRNDTFSNRLSNFNLYLSDSNFASNDPATTKGTAGVLTYFNGPPSPHPGYYDVRHPGRYVRIQQTANAPLNIYELEIYTSLYPVDTDGDGVADYLEDRNGNGTHDGGSGETNWNSYDSPNGLSGAGALQTFTPLK